MFDGFNQTIRRPTNGNQTIGQPSESLMMERRTRNLCGAERLVHLRTFLDRHLVHGELGTGRESARSVLRTIGFVDVLNQRTAERNVDELDATTHRKNRNVQIERGVEQSDFEIVLKAIDAING